MHLAGNLLPALALCLLLETRYGTARVGLLWAAAVAGGALVGAVLGPPCGLVRRLCPPHAAMCLSCIRLATSHVVVCRVKPCMHALLPEDLRMQLPALTL